MKYIGSLILSLIFALNLFPQQTFNWKNYTDMKITNDVTVTSDGFWAATDGGAYFYNQGLAEFKTLNKAEGLMGISLTAVCSDNYGKIWFGSSDGVIDIYDPATESFHSILDIFNSDKTSKRINKISVRGDTVFVATDFGLSLIDSKNYSFYDTYLKFGLFTSNIKVKNIFIDDLIYLATESGVAIQKVGAVNLSAPESWNVYNQSSGLSSNAINKLIKYNNFVIAATDNGLSILNGAIWQNYLGISATKVIDLLVDGNLLYILTASAVYTFDGNNLNQLLTLDKTPTRLAYNDNNLLISTDKGILENSILIYPNGPEANQFPNMTVDKDGNLWCASGKDVTGVGIYKYDGNEWTIYDISNYPELMRNSYYSIFCSSDNYIYGGTWGIGFSKIGKDQIINYNATNSKMIGIQSDLNFIVITGFAEDSKNNIWILNLNAADRKSLYMLTKDSLYTFINPLEGHSFYTETKNLVIDHNGTKWYTITNEGTIGLYYFNEKGTYTSTTDDAYGYLNKDKGLSSSDIFSLAVDRHGDLWVGTGQGVNIISNLNAVLTSKTPQFKISSSFSVRQQTINAIAVDPLDQKWVGTNEGLFLLNTDGTQLLASYTTNNSALLSNVVESITIDEKKGRVYVGTEAGLTSFDTPAILPAESFNGLNIFPNPLVIKDGSETVTIDGLIKDTDLKIISVSGKLVREYSSPGGKIAFWDGKDNDGNVVNSGIYIIIAFDREGNNVSTGKIAVLRK